MRSTYLHHQSFAPTSSGTLLLMMAIMLMLTMLPAQRPLTMPASFSTAPGALDAPLPRSDFGKLPLSFVANAGQSDPAVRFQAEGMGGSIFFTPEEVVLAFAPVL